MEKDTGKEVRGSILVVSGHWGSPVLGQEDLKGKVFVDQNVVIQVPRILPLERIFGLRPLGLQTDA